MQQYIHTFCIVKKGQNSISNMKTLKCNGLGKVLYWREAEEELLFTRTSQQPPSAPLTVQSERRREKERGGVDKYCPTPSLTEQCTFLCWFAPGLRPQVNSSRRVGSVILHLLQLTSPQEWVACGGGKQENRGWKAWGFTVSTRNVPSGNILMTNS